MHNLGDDSIILSIKLIIINYSLAYTPFWENIKSGIKKWCTSELRRRLPLVQNIRQYLLHIQSWFMQVIKFILCMAHSEY